MLDAVTACLLRRIHRGVGVFEQCAGVRPVMREHRQANRSRHIETIVAHIERFDQCFQYAFGDQQRDVFGVLRLKSRDQHHEFVTTKTRHQIVLSNRVFQARCGNAQHRVARIVAQTVVKCFEEIEIDKQHRNAALVGQRRLDGVFQFAAEQQAIGQARQRVSLRDLYSAYGGRVQLLCALTHTNFQRALIVRNLRATGGQLMRHLVKGTR